MTGSRWLVGVLEDHADLGAAYLQHLGVGDGSEVALSEENRTAFDLQQG